jgi:hypothetical protein
MVALKIGTTDASKVYLGSSQAQGVYLGSTKIWPAYTPVVFKGATGAANSITSAANMPPHVAGDLLVAFAFRATNTSPPTKPSSSSTIPAWTTLMNPAGNSCSGLLVYAIASRSDHISGAFSGTNSLIVASLGNVGATPIGANDFASANGTPTAPSVTMTNTDGTSALLHFLAANGTFKPDSWGAAPSGYTKQVTQDWTVLDTKNDTTSDGSMSNSQSGGGSGYFGVTLEVRSH